MQSKINTTSEKFLLNCVMIHKTESDKKAVNSVTFFSLHWISIIETHYYNGSLNS